MKLIIALAALALLTSTAAFAEVSCENDKICADGQKCVDGYCKETAALSTHGTLHRDRHKIPHTTDSKIPRDR